MLDRFARFVVRKGRAIEIFFIIATIVCAICYPFVGVNYDLSQYLPQEAPPNRRST